MRKIDLLKYARENGIDSYELYLCFEAQILSMKDWECYLRDRLKIEVDISICCDPIFMGFDGCHATYKASAPYVGLFTIEQLQEVSIFVRFKAYVEYIVYITGKNLFLTPRQWMNRENRRFQKEQLSMEGKK